MNVHLFLSAGRGPQACARALARLLRRLEADAARQGLRVARQRAARGGGRVTRWAARR